MAAQGQLSLQQMIHTGDVSKNWKLLKQKLELYVNMTNAAMMKRLNVLQCYWESEGLASML